MSKVLVTGGSGFIAAHVLKVLLDRGYSVVTTVRSASKGDQIVSAFGDAVKGRLSYVIVSDIAQEGAFDKAVVAEPPFRYVIHTASPFPTSVDDPVRDLLDPAIKGTTGILKAIKAYAPTVERVVITSSFAAMVGGATSVDGAPPVYDESAWNPVTFEEAATDKTKSYRGSKTLAERAAWKFVETEKPNFDVATICPPLVFGPVADEQPFAGLDSLNTSNLRIRDIVQGKHVNDKVIAPAGSALFTDVRDLALAHVRALEVAAAGGQRFFVTAGHYSGKQIVEVVREAFPERASGLPENLEDDLPKDVYGFDNTRVKTVLNVEFRSLKDSVVDTVASLLKRGA